MKRGCNGSIQPFMFDPPLGEFKSLSFLTLIIQIDILATKTHPLQSYSPSKPEILLIINNAKSNFTVLVLNSTMFDDKIGFRFEGKSRIQILKRMRPFILCYNLIKEAFGKSSFSRKSHKSYLPGILALACTE